MALWHVIIVVGMLATGATNTVMTNLQNLSNSYIHNRLPIQWISFSHPWFQTWLMFLGEALLIIIFLTNVESFRRAPEYASGKVVFRKIQPILIVPTLCDLTGSTVGNFALLLISASVWQMLRASNIIFTGILSVIFLRRRLHLFNWLGMSLVAIGITTVGVSSMLNAKDGGEHTSSTTHTIVGCCLVLVSQLIAACQMVLEETLLKNSHFPAVQVVGSEGIIGVVLMTCIVLPVVYFAFPTSNPLHDNAIQALSELANNHALFFFCLIFVISIAFYNYFAQSVVKELTAVHRTLIDACRTIAVWVVQLIIHYGINHNFGEEWMKFSWVQVIGFVFVVIGTLIYNKIIQVPGLYYPAPEGKEMHQTEEEKLVN